MKTGNHDLLYVVQPASQTSSNNLPKIASFSWRFRGKQECNFRNSLFSLLRPRNWTTCTQKSTNFQKSSSHFKILRITTVTRSKYWEETNIRYHRTQLSRPGFKRSWVLLSSYHATRSQFFLYFCTHSKQWQMFLKSCLSVRDVHRTSDM